MTRWLTGRLLAAALVDWFGTGLLLASGPVFLVRAVGLDISQIGLGFTVAAVAGVLASVPVGALADRWNPRAVLIVLHLWRAVMFVAYALLVRDLVTFVVVMSAIEVADMSVPAVNQSLIGALGGKHTRLRLLAYYRTMVNVGITVGGLAAALALGSVSRATFTRLLLADATSFVIAAGIVWLLPRLPSRLRQPHAADGRLRRVPRITYLFALVDGTLALYIVVLNVAMPLWIVQATHAPVQSVGALYAVNTVLVVALQVVVARRVSTTRRAALALLSAGTLLAASCLAFDDSAALRSPATVVAMLGAAVGMLTLAEVLYASGSWHVSYTLAPSGAPARGLATFGIGRTGSRVLGPVLMTSLVLARGHLGWHLLAATFAMAGLAIALLVARLGRQESHSAETSAAEQSLQGQEG